MDTTFQWAQLSSTRLITHSSPLSVHSSLFPFPLPSSPQCTCFPTPLLFSSCARTTLLLVWRQTMASRSVKPPQLPVTRPPLIRTTGLDPTPRQSSFGKLVNLALRDRAVAGHFKKTHDETVRVKDDREWSPMVIVDHPSEQGYMDLRRRARVVDVKAAGANESFPLRKLHSSNTISPSCMGKLARES